MILFLAGALLGWLFGACWLSNLWRVKYPDLFKQWTQRLYNPEESGAKER